MHFAPFNLRPFDGATVIWYDHYNAGAVKLKELLQCTDGIKCQEFQCCFHQHYLALYDGTSYNCHLWEFLDVNRLSKRDLDSRQNQLAGILELYHPIWSSKGTAAQSKCVACDMADWIFGPDCPVCLTVATERCIGCTIRGRKKICNHLDTICCDSSNSQAATAEPFKFTGPKFVLHGGSPPEETPQSLAIAKMMTPPNSRKFRNALDALYRTTSPELGTYLTIDEASPVQGPSGSTNSLDLATTCKRDLMLGQDPYRALLARMDEIMENQGRIERKVEMLLDQQGSATDGGDVNAEATEAVSTSPNTLLKDWGVTEEKVERLFLKTSSRSEFAVNLVRKMFKDDSEVIGHNCSGTKGKKKLNEEKMDRIRDLVLAKQPPKRPETAKTAWRGCVKIIDAHLRRVTTKAERALCYATTSERDPNGENSSQYQDESGGIST